jgi:hypothetical protein
MRTPAAISCLSAYAVSIPSRPRRAPSDMMSTWNGGRGFNAAMSRMNPGYRRPLGKVGGQESIGRQQCGGQGEACLGEVPVTFANCQVSVYCCQRITLPFSKSQT